MMKRLLFALLFALVSCCALAQAYPSRPLHVIVPFPPGGPTDVLGRVLGQGLSDALGQPAVVENKAGAAGNIGVDQLAKAAPDGYTLGIVPVGNIAVNPALFTNLPYKASDLAPVSMLATVENVLVVNPAVPAHNLKELLELAARKPDSVSFASPGAGSQAHLAGELLGLSSNVRLLHVAYKGIGPAMTDLLGGQVTMMFAQMSSALPYIKSGKLRAIAVGSEKRIPALPDVGTVAEAGFPGFETSQWYGVMVKAGTPPEIVKKLNAEINKALASNAVTQRYATDNAVAHAGSPEDFGKLIAAEQARWQEVVKKAHITIE